MPNTAHSHGQIDFNDTGSFESLDHGMSIESETSADYGIYGLDTPDHGIDILVKRRRRERILFILVDILVVCFICNRLIGFPSIGGILRLIHGSQGTQATQAAQTQSTDQTTEDGDATQDVATSTLTAGDLSLQACQLAFDGADLALPAEDVLVEVSQGHVQVTHTPKEPLYDGASLAGNAAMRAAALCASANGSSVQGDTETAPSPFTDVTWIVRNPEGEAYLVVCFDAGGAPTTGDGTTVLAQSPRYQLSTSVYSGLANTIPQSAGSTPTLLTGETIAPAASLAA